MFHFEFTSVLINGAPCLKKVNDDLTCVNKEDKSTFSRSLLDSFIKRFE